MSNPRVVKLDSNTTNEGLRVYIDTTGDPTGDDVFFKLTEPGGQPGVVGWELGTWVADSWSVTDAGTGQGRAEAVSPDVVGDLGAEDNGRYWVYVQWTVGSESPEHLAGILQMP